MHKSGFVNIIGRPNVGKSTLMNTLVGERMSIITNKPQTTRHRIIGIVSEPDYQIVFSDTPGVINAPAYKMQESMNSYVYGSFEDADLILFLTEPADHYADDDPILSKLNHAEAPIFLVINKIDASSEEQLLPLMRLWQSRAPFREIVPISALHKKNTDKLRDLIVALLPEGPEYYPSDQLTDRPERFFVSEIIREKILQQYEQEIPYSCEVAVLSFKEAETSRGQPITNISAEIYVSRKTQKSIIIGKDGSAIKRLGSAARADLETFLEQKVFLELHVKVKDNWRDDDRMLRYFGYE